MSSIIMEVIHMLNMLKYLTGFSMHSVSTFNKANANSIMCDGLLAKGNVGSRRSMCTLVRYCIANKNVKGILNDCTTNIHISFFTLWFRYNSNKNYFKASCLVFLLWGGGPMMHAVCAVSPAKILKFAWPTWIYILKFEINRTR